MTQLQMPPELEEALQSPADVVELRLRLRERTEVPPEIGALVNLRELTVRGGRIRSFPAELWQLTKLEKLKIGMLDGGLPAEINQLTNLRELKVEQPHNGEGAGVKLFPSGLGRLNKLESLRLIEPWLAGFPTEICELTSLRELTVIGGKLGALPAAIGSLQQLKKLSLDNAGVSSLPGELRKLSVLEILEVSECALHTIPREIAQLPALRKLSLPGCAFTAIRAFIAELPSLTVLDFDGNPLTSIPRELGQLKTLENLHLADCGISEIPAELWDLPKLRFVTLTGNRFSEEAYQAAVEAAARGISVDMPRKPKVRWVPVDVNVPLSDEVTTQIVRIGAKLRDTPRQSQKQVTIGAETYPVPLAVQQLVDGVDYPAEPLSAILWDEETKLALNPMLTGGRLEEFECVQNRPYFVFAEYEDYSMIAISLDDKNPSDPEVFYVDRDDYAETEPLRLEESLSEFLGGLKPM